MTSSSSCHQLHCRHGNHNCASAASEFAEFAASFLFSLGFSERLVNPRKTLDVNILLADLIRTSKVSFSALALGLLYMKRYATNNPANLQYSVYPVFVTALMAASKYLEDNTYTNKTWSTLTGFKLLELNGLEMHFLQALRFKMHVPEAEYSEWLAQLLAFACQRQQQQQLLQSFWNSPAEEEGAVLAPASFCLKSVASPVASTMVAAPSSPAGAKVVSPQSAVRSQLVHLQTHHFGAVASAAKRPRSRSPPSHPRHPQQQLSSPLPPISSFLPSPSLAFSRGSKRHSASPLSKYRPYPELLPSHTTRAVHQHSSPVALSPGDFFAQMQGFSPSCLPPLYHNRVQQQSQQLPSLWGAPAASFENLFGGRTTD